MRCILEHDKLILVAESNFEEGYLGELLSNKMQGKAKRDSLGNISQLEFFKKKSEEIDILIPIEELSDEETAEFVEGKKEELVKDIEELYSVESKVYTVDTNGKSEYEVVKEIEELKKEYKDSEIEELDSVESKVIKPREIKDLGDIYIDDGLDDLDLDDMEINFDEVYLDLEN